LRTVAKGFTNLSLARGGLLESPRQMNRIAPWLLLSLVACHDAGGRPEASHLPPPDPGVHPTLRLLATGTQRYACVASDGGAAWGPAAPEAQLSVVGSDGTPVGRHFAGPTWEFTADHSRFVGDKARATVLASPAADLAWLRIPRMSGSDGGVLGAARLVERIDTRGGLISLHDPGCTPAAAAARLVATVPYSATYVFFEAN
jgi:hypothetical protein